MRPVCVRKAVSLKEFISALKKRGRFFPSHCGNCLQLSSPSQLCKYDRRVLLLLLPMYENRSGEVELVLEMIILSFKMKDYFLDSNTQGDF